MKKLFIVMIAAMSPSGMATFSATAQFAQSNQYSQLQSSAAIATDPLTMDSAPSLNQDSVRQVQQALQKRGFDPGPVDGILGPKTKEAIRNFQDRYGMNASGDIDNQTLYALGVPELAGPRVPPARN